MSRAGKPTDNPVNESLNGWIKEEFHNKKRPCYAIGYDTPDNYYKRFRRGEIEKKDTFSKRELTQEPKFVQKKREEQQNE